ncbi:cysteine proteinases superfamily protein [Striga asiatica]|uniref:Cysteine proteinases superfamily protein n=1 Tax=Striga asiatica TaxID=4170 RepID=A0A5A7QM86_STRAF|nr:cysteine proteinases superfamily protein [Striga asiatica]
MAYSSPRASPCPAPAGRAPSPLASGPEPNVLSMAQVLGSPICSEYSGVTGKVAGSSAKDRLGSSAAPVARAVPVPHRIGQAVPLSVPAPSAREAPQPPAHATAPSSACPCQPARSQRQSTSDSARQRCPSVSARVTSSKSLVPREVDLGSCQQRTRVFSVHPSGPSVPRPCQPSLAVPVRAQQRLVPRPVAPSSCPAPCQGPSRLGTGPNPASASMYMSFILLGLRLSCPFLSSGGGPVRLKYTIRVCTRYRPECPGVTGQSVREIIDTGQSVREFQWQGRRAGVSPAVVVVVAELAQLADSGHLFTMFSVAIERTRSVIFFENLLLLVWAPIEARGAFGDWVIKLILIHAEIILLINLINVEHYFFQLCSSPPEINVSGTKKEYVFDIPSNMLNANYNAEKFDWKRLTSPGQSNGFDCGMFTIKFIEFFHAGKNVEGVDQSRISDWRVKLTTEIFGVHFDP